MVRFQKVTKIYPRAAGGAAALRDVTFGVAKGEFVFLTGPSGAGKSTILKLLYMDERPSSGEVRVSGFSSRDVKRREIPELRRKLGIIFQDFQLLEDRTAEGNVAFARALVNDPFVLIADEPTGNLDERATRGIFQLLREVNAAGTAVLMATHNLELVRSSDYRCIELNHGEIVFDSAEVPAISVEMD